MYIQFVCSRYVPQCKVSWLYDMYVNYSSTFCSIVVSSIWMVVWSDAQQWLSCDLLCKDNITLLQVIILSFQYEIGNDVQEEDISRILDSIPSKVPSVEIIPWLSRSFIPYVITNMPTRLPEVASWLEQRALSMELVEKVIPWDTYWQKSIDYSFIRLFIIIIIYFFFFAGLAQSFGKK